MFRGFHNLKSIDLGTIITHFQDDHLADINETTRNN